MIRIYDRDSLKIDVYYPRIEITKKRESSSYFMILLNINTSFLIFETIDSLSIHLKALGFGLGFKFKVYTPVEPNDNIEMKKAA
jgi:hypothetical protein